MAFPSLKKIMINHVFFLLFYALNAINETCFKGIQDTDHVTIISMKLWCSNSIIGSCNQINYDVIIESVNKASLKWQSRDSALFPLKKSKKSLPNNLTQQRPVSSENMLVFVTFLSIVESWEFKRSTFWFIWLE